jgi:hypothetical protein
MITKKIEERIKQLNEKIDKMDENQNEIEIDECITRIDELSKLKPIAEKQEILLTDFYYFIEGLNYSPFYQIKISNGRNREELLKIYKEVK